MPCRKFLSVTDDYVTVLIFLHILWSQGTNLKTISIMALNFSVMLQNLIKIVIFRGSLCETEEVIYTGSWAENEQ
jgi:hypothetical protein